MGMDELSEEQGDELRVRLVELVGELERALRAGASAIKPVVLDQSSVGARAYRPHDSPGCLTS